jgi:hypothetical protein
MPGLIPVQANVAYYGVAGAANALACAFTNPNVSKNIGIAWITSDTGAGPSGCTDTLGNIWYALPGYFSNGGYSTLFVCPSLNPGVNTVTVAGLVPPISPRQSPVLTIMEYQPQGCYPCNIGFQVLQAALACNGINLSWYDGPVLTMQSMYSASGGVWYSTLIAFINTTSADASGIARTWSLAGFPGYYAGILPGVRVQYEDTGSLETGAVADCTIPYPYALNYIEFEASPTPAPTPIYPSPNASIATAMIGLLVSTQG